MTRPTVIIVNYNGGGALLRCLAALDAQTIPIDTIVVDNASTDDSLRLVHEGHRRVRCLPMRRNSGFARAFNIGVSRIDAADDVVIALNPDTSPEPDFVERIVAPLIAQPELGAVAGTLTFSIAPETIASAGIVVHRNGVAIDARLGDRLKEPHDDAWTPVFGPSGGAAAYRLRMFRQLGGFCEPFFLYLEDVDFAWRMRLAGYASVWAPGARAQHDYSASAGEGSTLKRRLIARNRIWTLARCLPPEIWRRDRASILAFDLLAATYGLATLDPALRGRLDALASLPLRLREGTIIRSRASSSWDEVDRWLLPPISPQRLRTLRRLTGKLANQSNGSNSATGDVDCTYSIIGGVHRSELG